MRSKQEIKLVITPEEQRQNQRMIWEVLKAEWEKVKNEIYSQYPYIIADSLKTYFEVFIENDKKRKQIDQFFLTAMSVFKQQENFKQLFHIAKHALSLSYNTRERDVNVILEVPEKIEPLNGLLNFYEGTDVDYTFNRVEYDVNRKLLLTRCNLTHGTMELIKILYKEGYQVSNIELTEV